MPSEPILSVTSLARSFGSVQAVKDVTFNAAAGEVTAILGRNGAGKTTSIECCLGLVTGWGGEIVLWGTTPLSPAVRGRVGAMLQDVGIPRGVTARAALKHIGGMYEAPLDSMTLLERVAMSDLASSRVESLSGGELKRLALAAALIGQPDLVFLDEPSAGLDPHAKRDLWALIEELKADGVAVVLTTHDMVEAEALADVVTIVDRGRDIATGTVSHIKKRFGAKTLEDAFLAATEVSA